MRVGPGVFMFIMLAPFLALGGGLTASVVSVSNATSGPIQFEIAISNSTDTVYCVKDCGEEFPGDIYIIHDDGAIILRGKTVENWRLHGGFGPYAETTFGPGERKSYQVPVDKVCVSNLTDYASHITAIRQFLRADDTKIGFDFLCERTVLPRKVDEDSTKPSAGNESTKGGAGVEGGKSEPALEKSGETGVLTSPVTEFPLDAKPPAPKP